MTAPFVTELRNDGDVIVVEGGNGTMLHLRVQVAELWDALRIDAPGTASVESVKNAALAAFFPHGANSGDFVAKVRGFEILDEGQGLEASGIRNGSTILLHRRRRRAVR
jgi:hypothetical protein